MVPLLVQFFNVKTALVEKNESLALQRKKELS